MGAAGSSGWSLAITMSMSMRILVTASYSVLPRSARRFITSFHAIDRRWKGVRSLQGQVTCDTLLTKPLLELILRVRFRGAKGAGLTFCLNELQQVEPRLLGVFVSSSTR